MNNFIKIFYTIALIIMISSCMQPVTKLGLSYGAFHRPGGIEFKIYAPSSDIVKLVIFEKVDDESGYEYPMEKLKNGYIYYYYF